MRYTEARMASISDEMLADIEKETVDFVDNYDGRLRQPVVLPSRLPNLLVNGSSGIAVGMATNIPPHNLREICRHSPADRQPGYDGRRALRDRAGPRFSHRRHDLPLRGPAQCADR